MRALVIAGLMVVLLASPAVALETRSFPRTTLPHAPTLSATLATLIPGSFHLHHQNDVLIVEAASWAGVDLQAVQAAVDAAPADVPTVRAKFDMDATRGRAACLVEAFARALVPVLNDARQNPLMQRPAITAAQVRASLKDEIDALGCGG